MRLTHARRTPSALAAAALLATVLLPAGGAAPAAAATATTVTIDPGLQYQTIQGWGTSLAWWAEGAGGWNDAGQRNRLADALFDPTTGLGLNVVRYNIGGYGPGETCTAPFRTGGAAPSYEPAPGQWRFDADPTQVGMLRAAVDRGADHVDAIAYSAPVWMTRNGCTQGAAPTPGQRTADNLDPAHYQDFADYLATVATHLRGEGLPVDTIDPFNEPSITAWVGNAQQEGMNVDEQGRASVIAKLAKRLQRGGPAQAIGISGPDEATTPAAASEVAGYSLTDPDVRSDITQLNAHNYQGASTSDATFGNLGTRDNTPVWMSEWGDYGTTAGGQTPDQMGTALDLSQRIVKNEDQMHPAAWVAWQGVDGPVDGGDINDLWGLVWANITPGASTPVSCPADEQDPDYPTTLCYPKRYWAMGNYSKYVRPGAIMLHAADSNTFATYDAGARQLVIVTTNPTTSAVQRSFDLSGFASVGSTAETHLTDPSHNLATMAPAPTSGSSLPVTLPAKSVTTYVLPATMHAADAPTELAASSNAIAYSGNGWSSDQVSSHHGDTATVSFTGTRARLFADRTPASGTATVSIDGGRPTDIDLYAARRDADALVYESPDLAAGTHQLTIEVDGRANPGSSGTAVGFTRAEVDGSSIPAGSLVHAQALGSARHDFTGSTGMQITTGADGLTVHAIGRYHLDGDQQTHTVSIVRVSDGATVATAQLDAAHADIDKLGYQYADLSTPVHLAPDTSYAVLSSELNGGDPFADSNATYVTTAAGVGVDGPAYVDTEGGYHVYTGNAGQSYGPVSLRIDQH